MGIKFQNLSETNFGTFIIFSIPKILSYRKLKEETSKCTIIVEQGYT